MARPVLKLKPKRPPNALQCPKCDGWLVYAIENDRQHCNRCDYDKGTADLIEDGRQTYPSCWTKGQLLNLRRNGDLYILTLLNEEYDQQHPERSMMFDNSYACQEFVSAWYSRDISDPRAI